MTKSIACLALAVASVAGTAAPGALDTFDHDSVEYGRLLGALVTFGSAEAAAAARGPSPRIAFLDDNWALNEAR